MNRHTRMYRLICAVLLSLMLTGGTGALAAGGAVGEAAVSAFSKQGQAGDVITFSAGDFQVTPGSGAQLDAVIVTTLPALSAGVLTVGDTAVKVGDEVALGALNGLRLTLAADPGVDSVTLHFTPVFSNGTLGPLVPVTCHLLSAPNSAPVAENLTLNTYQNVAVTGRFGAVDPEGDLLTYRLVSKPARGAVTQAEEGGDQFVYTPYENKKGKDTFTYVAVDAVGNTSAPATVQVQIDKAKTKVTYADLEGHAAGPAAIRLAEAGVFVGEQVGAAYFFQPEQPLTRGEFVAMAMNTCGVEALEGVERTGFADDAAIPTWAKPYVSSALKAGLVQGTRNEEGQVVFQSNSPVTLAEASVLLDRMLSISDVAEETLCLAGAPAWASQAAANLVSCGVMDEESSLSQPLTRGEAAQLLCGALDVLEQRQDGGWLWW